MNNHSNDNIVHFPRRPKLTRETKALAKAFLDAFHRQYDGVLLEWLDTGVTHISNDGQATLYFIQKYYDSGEFDDDTTILDVLAKVREYLPDLFMENHLQFDTEDVDVDAFLADVLGSIKDNQTPPNQPAL